MRHSFGCGFNYLEDVILVFSNFTFVPLQPMEIYVDDEAKLTLHGLVQVWKFSVKLHLNNIIIWVLI